MQKVLKYVGKIVQVLITVLLALLLACNLYLIIINRVIGVENPTIFGYSTAVVASGSMEPVLSVDDLILNHVQASYGEGDIITFQSGDSLTTHHIVAVTGEGYITQGDANNVADPEVVLPEAVVGRVIVSIPHIGSVISFLKTPVGMVILVFTVFLLIEIPLLFQRSEKTDRGGTIK